MSTRLNFRLQGAGWAILEIESDTATIVVDAISYCTNALDDFVRMGLDIATGKGIASTIVDHEPALSAVVAETAWIEDNDWHSGARVSVIRDLPAWIEPTFKWRASVKTDEIIHVQSRDELARLFLDMALRVRGEHGEEGYSKLWAGQRRFPGRAVAALQAALNCPASEPYNYGV